MIQQSPTGSIHLWSCDTHEFMNECHSPEDGKFCPGGGGKGSGGKGSGGKGPGATQDNKDAKKSATIAKKIWGDDTVSHSKAKKETDANWLAVAATVVAVGIYLEYASGFPIISQAGAHTLGKYQAKRAAAKYAGAPVSKGIYTTLGANGKTLKLVNHSDKLSGKQRNKLLHSFKQTYDNDPLPGDDAPTLNVWENSDIAKDALGFYIPSEGNLGISGGLRPAGTPGIREINVNRGVLFDFDLQKGNFARLPHNGTRWHMNNSSKDPIRSTVAHEYGHMRDNHFETEANSRTNGFFSKSYRRSMPYDQARDFQWVTPGNRGDLYGKRSNGISHYGQTKSVEGYAETYSEWSATDGKSTNKAVQNYAREFDWKISKHSGSPMGPIGGGAIPLGPIGSTGDRIVRTAEGARRYGVSVGQVIPEVKASGAMETFITGTIRLSPPNPLLSLELTS